MDDYESHEGSVLAPMSPAHLAGAVELSRAEGWPHRIEDWALILSRSRGVVALQGAQVVATAMATPLGLVATLNMVLVDKNLRGIGLGRRIVERALEQASPPEWRLVATEAGLPLYRKLGFEPSGEVHQHQGVARAATSRTSEARAAAPDLPQLVALDRAATGMDRTWLIGALLRDGRILVTREREKVVAFAALRRFGRGELVGPVVARTEEGARELLAPILVSCAGQFLRVDIPGGTELGPWLAAHGLPVVGRGIDMSRGLRALNAGPFRRFALAAQALG